MQEDRQQYRGHTIERRVGEGAVRFAAAPDDEAREATAELFIDNEPVFTVRNSAGMYLATGFAYAPQDSLLNLARRLIDVRERDKEGRRGGPEESSQPDPS